MKEWMALNDPSAFKALSHPIRAKILGLLTKKQASVNDLARELDMVHAKVHYHVMSLIKCNLIEQVGQATKNGIIEKFYRTVAKTFFIGHSIGSNTELASTALTAVEENILKHRRDEILEINYTDLAKRIVSNSLSIGKGHKVLIEGSSAHKELMEALALECRKLGAEGLVRLVTSDYFFNVMNEVDSDILAKAPPFTTMLYEQIDFWISIGTLEGRSIFRNAPKEKMAKWKEGGILAIEKANRNLKTLVVEWPSREWADELGLVYIDAHDAFWKALNVPIPRLNKLGKDIVNKLRTKGTIKLQGSKNTYLEFTLDDHRPILLNDGKMHNNIKEDYDADLILPGGKIIFAPIEESINGIVMIPEFDYRGSIIKDIELTIKNGVITNINAKDYTHTLNDVLNRKGGFSVGSITIGFNEGLKDYNGDLLFNLIKPNAVGIGLGNNLHLGGRVESEVPLYFGIGVFRINN